MKRVRITEFGAVADDQTLATEAIRMAIDTVASQGGGVVVVPPGRFLTGMVRMRSHVELHLSAGAVLAASADPEDHRPWTSLSRSGDLWKKKGKEAWHLILAEDCHDIAITGHGRLDGQGDRHYQPLPKGQPGWPRAFHADGRRPGALVQISSCTRVRIQDIRMGNVANWTLHLFSSDHCQVRDIHIENPADAPNADGIDINACRFVTVSGCHIDTCDDAICLKTNRNTRSCENITVTGCVLRTSCAALKLGASESFHDMRNVIFADCTVTGSSRAIALYSLEGAVCENIAISNVVCDTKAPLMFTRPIHVDVRRKTPESRTGAVRNLRISGLLAETNGRCLFTAADGCTIEDVVLRDVVLRYPVVDDPQPLAAKHGGGQFSNNSPWARTARAAVVMDGVDGLSIDGLRVHWPEAGTRAALDPAWTPAAKLANGDDHIFQPDDWTCAPETPFAAIALRNTSNDQIDTSRLEGFQGGPAVDRN